MQDENKQEKPDEEVKKRAIRRVGGAAVLALLAAIGLTMITYQKPKESPVAPVAPVAPIATSEPTVMPAELPVSAAQVPVQPPLSAVQVSVQPPVSAVAETPTVRAAPPTTTQPPPPPQVVNVPQAPSESAPKLVKPVAVKPSRETEQPAAKPSLAIVPPLLEKGAKPRSVQELVPARETAAKASEAAAKASEMKKPAEAPKVVEPTKPVASAQPPAQPPAAQSSPAPKGYAVQLGVFSNPANAIQLQEKLLQNGIKSYTETKLNVGPFQNKAEADQAMAKVRSLGIGAVVVPVR